MTTANAVLARGGSISGTVTSSITGAPLEDVDVSILDVDGYEFEWTDTDVNGQYLARGLPTGVYHVHFSISYCSLKYQIYYNQKTSLASADHVSVTAPGLIPNINGQLPVPATINISQCFLPVW